MHRLFSRLTVLGLGITLVALTAAAASAQPANSHRRTIPEVMAIQNRETDRLMRVADVVGTATGVDDDGTPVVLVFTKDEGVRGLPSVLDDVPVRVKVTGEFRVLPAAVASPAQPEAAEHAAGKGGRPTPVSTTQRFARPVPIGVSTGNEGECSAGTIGARVTDGSNVYALSNNHVFARENLAPLGSRILQPGPYDTNCAADPDNAIGTLTSFVPIVISQSASNTVDAALALSSTASLGRATPSDGYGTPSATVTPAVLGLAVKKYGRTTHLTRGTVTAINATINVGYSAGVARFVNQVIIEARRAVIKAGDSGSLAVTDDAAAHPVGLLFAGNSSGTLAVANRIENVLAAFGVAVDGL